MGTIRAKFYVSGVKRSRWQGSDLVQKQVEMSPVTGADPTNPNHAFWKATPNGSIQMTVSDERVFGAFEVGKEFYVDFSPAEEE